MEGRRPLGRPKMTWSKVVEEDRKLNITEDMAEDRKQCGSYSYHVQPQEWETRDNERR